MSEPDLYASDDGVLRFEGGADGAVYRDFEEVFRGDETTIQDRQRVYLPLLTSAGPVLDAGSGRGEFLELIKESGVEAMGVDLDADMVGRATDKGLDVVQADVASFLADSADGHFGAIFSAQMIEHLDLEQLTQFLVLSRRKLRSGGVFIAETVNPHSFRAFRTFWTDLSHRAPIFPEVALTLVRSAGFESGYIMYPNGTGEFASDTRSCGEYAVVAYT
jgi:O-antigen chain-terminating methyltransferase